MGKLKYNVRKGEISMNVMKIGSDSIKISLSEKEAKLYHINEETSDQESKNNLVSVLLVAKEKINFKLAGEKIVAEIFSTQGGGCEIFLSCVEVGDRLYKDRNPSQDVSKKQKQILNAFSFDSLEKLLTVAKRLNDINYDGESSVYYDEDKSKYFFILEDVSTRELKYTFLLEYAKSMKLSACTYIKEHYKCLCGKDAVKVFSALN